ncbi:hypothetical protein RIF29_08651 [Crotalaria pallida]|uniref:DDE Tnp4 domain-containing protein n=1 Tax=Crotalaria pallida TaxID=3830 RepID=A0AAN9IJ33_CROPI
MSIMAPHLLCNRKIVMDDKYICHYLLGWRMNVHILAMNAVGFFFFKFVLRNDYERRALSERALARYETRRVVLESIIGTKPVPQDCVDERWKWFKGCLGALDGTYIAVTPSASDRPRYRTRKGRLATNVLGVCTRDMQFIYVLAGWEGSASDSRILRDAVIGQNGLVVPIGAYYLVDGGYTNGEGFLAPYRGKRYHLQEWNSGRRTPQNREELFNYRHARARNVIERCFGLLKKRWGILRSPSFYPIRTQSRIILACCLLHNFVRMNMAIDPEELSSLPEDTQPVGEEPINIIGTVEPSNEWTQMRDALAQDMFMEWRNRLMASEDGDNIEQSRNNTGSRRNWTKQEVETLLTILEELVVEGNKQENGTFKTGSHEEACMRMRNRIPGITLTIKHIVNKMKRWSSKLNDVVDMMNTSGFGWDDTRKCVTCDNSQVLSEYLEVDDDWLPHDNSPPSVGNTNEPPPKRQRLAHVATKFLESFESKMDAVTADFGKVASKLPDPSKRDLVEEVKKLGLTEEEEIDLVIKFSHNQPYEKFFWEFHGPQRMTFVRKIMKM